MTALNFLEWYQQIGYDCIGIVDEVLDFYNQPFSVDMLVKPYEFPPLDVFDANGEIHTNPNYEQDAYNFQQAESLRLFDGWEENSCYDVIHGGSKVAINEYKLMYCGEFVMAFETLNDFITLCNLEGIGLRFNESNETIKKLFESKGCYKSASLELIMETYSNSWHVTKPELKKGYCLLCYSSVGGWTASYDIREKEGELILINPDGEERDYSKFKYLFYKLVKYPESEVGG